MGMTRVTELGQSEKGREPGDVGVTTARSYQEGEGQQGQILSKTREGRLETICWLCKASLVSLEIAFRCGTGKAGTPAQTPQNASAPR